MCEGMIQKNRAKLEESLAKNAHMIHMTGLDESREEFIADILNGTLNYYDYEILYFDENEAKVRLLAKVYGGSKSWWTLSMQTKYEEEDQRIKISESRVRLG